MLQGGGAGGVATTTASTASTPRVIKCDFTASFGGRPEIEPHRNVVVHCDENILRNVDAEVGHVHAEGRGRVNVPIGNENDTNGNRQPLRHAVQREVAGDFDVSGS